MRRRYDSIFVYISRLFMGLPAKHVGALIGHVKSCFRCFSYQMLKSLALSF